MEDVADFIESTDSNRDGLIDYKEYMAALEDTFKASGKGSRGTSCSGEGDEVDVDDDDADSTSVRDTGGRSSGNSGHSMLAKIEPYGAEELREVLVKRRQAEIAKERKERLRRDAYKDALDVKVFEEELLASKRRKGGANPLISERRDLVALPRSAVGAVGSDGESEISPTEVSSSSLTIKTTDFTFFHNHLPLRFTATGKTSLLPWFSGTAAQPTIAPMLCSKKHKVVELGQGAVFAQCSTCPEGRSCTRCCQPCNYYVCSTCVEADQKMKQAAIDDLSDKPTFLRCSALGSLTLQVPTAGGSDPHSGRYTVTLEIRLEKLPAAGQLQSLLRFPLPDSSTLAVNKSHFASVWINSEGVVAGVPLVSQKAPKAPDIVPAVKTAPHQPKANAAAPQQPQKSFGYGNPTLQGMPSPYYPGQAPVGSFGSTFGTMPAPAFSMPAPPFSMAAPPYSMSAPAFSSFQHNSQPFPAPTFCGQMNMAPSASTGSVRPKGLDSRAQVGARSRSAVNDTGGGNAKRNGNIDEPPMTVSVPVPSATVSHLRLQRWAVVSVVVDPTAGTVTTFIDGLQCHTASGLDPAGLRLQYKLNVFGGGKQADSRGGDIRRVLIHSEGKNLRFGKPIVT